MNLIVKATDMNVICQMGLSKEIYMNKNDWSWL